MEPLDPGFKWEACSYFYNKKQICVLLELELIEAAIFLGKCVAAALRMKINQSGYLAEMWLQ